MYNKPIKRFAHGIIDYGFAATLIIVPRLLGLNGKNVKLYTALGTGLATVNAFTDNDVAISPEISFESHKKFDVVNLATIGALTCTKMVRQEKKAAVFHAAVLALTLTNFVLTDWDS